VWEWTLSLFGKNDRTPEFEYPYDPSDGWEDLGAGDDLYRVIRGDARYFSATNARAAKRRAQLPDGRYVNTGFRVVVSSGSR